MVDVVDSSHGQFQEASEAMEHHASMDHSLVTRFTPTQPLLGEHSESVIIYREEKMGRWGPVIAI